MLSLGTRAATAAMNRSVLMPPSGRDGGGGGGGGMERDEREARFSRSSTAAMWGDEPAVRPRPQVDNTGSIAARGGQPSGVACQYSPYQDAVVEEYDPEAPPCPLGRIQDRRPLNMRPGAARGQPTTEDRINRRLDQDIAKRQAVLSEPMSDAIAESTWKKPFATPLPVSSNQQLGFIVPPGNPAEATLVPEVQGGPVIRSVFAEAERIAHAAPSTVRYKSDRVSNKPFVNRAPLNPVEQYINTIVDSRIQPTVRRHTGPMGTSLRTDFEQPLMVDTIAADMITQMHTEAPIPSREIRKIQNTLVQHGPVSDHTNETILDRLLQPTPLAAPPRPVPIVPQAGPSTELPTDIMMAANALSAQPGFRNMRIAPQPLLSGPADTAVSETTSVLDSLMLPVSSHSVRTAPLTTTAPLTATETAPAAPLRPTPTTTRRTRTNTTVTSHAPAEMTSNNATIPLLPPVVLHDRISNTAVPTTHLTPAPLTTPVAPFVPEWTPANNTHSTMPLVPNDASVFEFTSNAGPFVPERIALYRNNNANNINNNNIIYNNNGVTQSGSNVMLSSLAPDRVTAAPSMHPNALVNMPSDVMDSEITTAWSPEWGVLNHNTEMIRSLDNRPEWSEGDQEHVYAAWAPERAAVSNRSDRLVNVWSDQLDANVREFDTQLSQWIRPEIGVKLNHDVAAHVGAVTEENPYAAALNRTIVETAQPGRIAASNGPWDGRVQQDDLSKPIAGFQTTAENGNETLSLLRFQQSTDHGLPGGDVILQDSGRDTRVPSALRRPRERMFQVPTELDRVEDDVNRKSQYGSNVRDPVRTDRQLFKEIESKLAGSDGTSNWTDAHFAAPQIRQGGALHDLMKSKTWGNDRNPMYDVADFSDTTNA